MYLKPFHKHILFREKFFFQKYAKIKVLILTSVKINTYEYMYVIQCIVLIKKCLLKLSMYMQ